MASSFPFPIKELSSDRILLTPFDPAAHLQPYLAGASPHPELFDYLPYGPFNEPGDIESFYNHRIVSDPASFLFAIITQTTTPQGPAGSFAGVIGLLFAQPENAACEIGYITVLPPFQRSYVTTNATGLLLHYLLDTPSQGGLGIRRAVWQANSNNEKSCAAAKRLGWHFEGIARWQRVLPAGKKGLEVRQREEDGSLGMGRSTAVFSMCWDDWEGGKREHVTSLMNR